MCTTEVYIEISIFAGAVNEVMMMSHRWLTTRLAKLIAKTVYHLSQTIMASHTVNVSSVVYAGIQLLTLYTGLWNRTIHHTGSIT